MDQDNPDDPIDELFELFELEDGPPSRGSEPPPRTSPPATPNQESTDAEVSELGQAGGGGDFDALICTSCGTTNPAHNRHCEQCGARVGSGPLPIAPTPIARSTPGARALTVIGAAMTFVAATLFVLYLSPEGPVTTATTTSPTTTNPPFVELKPASVRASSAFSEFEAANLIDGQDSTYWNDNSLAGRDAWLEFEFASGVAITEIEIRNLEDEEKFLRNYRIRSITVKVNDLATEINHVVPDTSDPHRIPVRSVNTTTIRISINSTHPAQAYNDNPPYTELALQSVRFFGTDT